MKYIIFILCFVLIQNKTFAKQRLTKEDVILHIEDIYNNFDKYNILMEYEAFVKKKEGFKNKCYKDGKRKSIGYGFNDLCNNGITYITKKDADWELRYRIMLLYMKNFNILYSNDNYIDLIDLIKKTILIVDLEYNVNDKWYCVNGKYQKYCEYSRVYQAIFNDKKIDIYNNEWFDNHYLDYNKVNGVISNGLTKRRYELLTIIKKY